MKNIDLEGVEKTMRTLMNSTPEQRARALDVTAAAIPHLDEEFGFGICDFFIVSAFSVAFISRGEIPTNTQISDLANFLNGIKAGDTKQN